MPWTMTAGVAQYGGADWDNYLQTVPNCSPALAQLIAFQNPQIAYFFHCRDALNLGDGRDFLPGDAVFFSGAEKPQWADAPQCDGYARLCLAVAYTGTTTVDIQAALELTYQGSPALDAVIFTVNMNNIDTIPSGYAQIVPSATGPSVLTANASVQALLPAIAPLVAQAHGQGTAIVMCVVNNWDSAGWAEFQTLADAQQFAGQCATVLAQYGFDGVDIDDEYSQGTVNNTSLAMVSYCLDGTIAPKTLSKALYGDTQYQDYTYDNTTVFQNLTWGWTMTYGLPAEYQVKPYSGLMDNNRVCCGYWDQRTGPTQDEISWLYAGGYAGVMVYAIDDSGGPALLNTLLGYWSTATGSSA
ncbi:MAG TPA: glycosyl hydrolase family 18 protein [Rhizomicrobium sp.]|nr:glycosyl hydrolase family 18 protein [Rhizomicrobium sp.]